jgi:hypothetical protein
MASNKLEHKLISIIYTSERARKGEEGGGKGVGRKWQEREKGRWKFEKERGIEKEGGRGVEEKVEKGRWGVGGKGEEGGSIVEKRKRGGQGEKSGGRGRRDAKNRFRVKIV